MAVTLEQAKVGMNEKVCRMVYDEFRRSSALLELLTFDDVVAPGTGSNAWTYSYMQLQTPSMAAFRALNGEYASGEAVRRKVSADLKIFGGSAAIDRVLSGTNSIVSEMEFQINEKIKGARNLFHYTVINGDSSANENEFDGLSKMLTGKSTEFNAGEGTYIDLSTSEQVEANYKKFLDMLDEFLSELDGRPDLLLGNSKLITRIKSAARRAGYLTQSEDAFGRGVSCYDGIRLMDMGCYYNGSCSTPAIKTYDSSETPPQGGVAAMTSATDLYAVSLGLDGFHGVSPMGAGVINTYLPDLTQPGAVKKVEVEMCAAVVLKNSRKAGVFRNIIVQ